MRCGLIALALLLLSGCTLRQQEPVVFEADVPGDIVTLEDFGNPPVEETPAAVSEQEIPDISAFEWEEPERFPIENMPEPEDMLARLLDQLIYPIIAPAGPRQQEQNGVLWIESPALADWQTNAEMLISSRVRHLLQIRMKPMMQEIEGVWYARADAAEALGWDFTLDMDTFAVVNRSEGSCRFSIEGTGRGGRILWGFYYYASPYIEGDIPQLTEFFDMGHGPVGEYDILIDGTWHGILCDGPPPTALGEPRSVTETACTEYQGDFYSWSYVERVMEYPGCTLVYHENESGSTLYDFTLYQEPDAPSYTTWRGISCGMTEEELLAAYPEFITDDYPWYEYHCDWYGSHISFRVTDGIVTEIGGSFIRAD